MRRLLDTNLSADISTRIRAASSHRVFPVFGEVFVTNRHGANVAQTPDGVSTPRGGRSAATPIPEFAGPDLPDMG